MLVAIEAVLAATLLPAIARNKVEGLALTKLTNIAGVVPLLAIIPSPWRLLGGLLPTYWIGEMLGLSTVEPLPVALALGLAIAVHLGFAALLFRVLARRVG